LLTRSNERQGVRGKLKNLEEKIEELSSELKTIKSLLDLIPGGDLISFLIHILSLGISFQGDLTQAFRKVLKAKRILTEKGLYDEIILSLVNLLAVYGPLNISELTRLLRKIRGRASRRIVAEKLEMLEKLGLVERVKGKGKKYKLTTN